MQGSWRAAWQIAFTYIGTVVGAGFASGKEIVEFFVQYGTQGFVGILLATALFVWAGIRIMLISYRLQASSYQEVSTYLFGHPFGTVFNTLLLTVLLGTTSVMLAATGAIFMESFQLSSQIGIWISMVMIFIVTRKGLFAIHHVNSIFVPALIGFTFLVFLHTKPWEDSAITVESLRPFAWLSSPFYYVALNVSLTQAVLIPMGRHSKGEQPLIAGGILGGLGIGLLLLLAYFSLSVKMPGIQQAEMPMIALLQGAGRGIPLLFSLLVYAEIFSTLVANVFGLSEQLRQVTRLRGPTILLAILAISYFISFIGFSSLLRFLYPLFGQLVVFFLVMLMYRQWRGRTY
ncbi:YkvI family membrane protein [Brevibacillus sp. NRS-1366]|uniref:YkvI family membrane protein n=1 Tax=Brevibacillus sp. NRS-1366 TaxID=3233899 RepID=UPI003D22C095